MNEALTHAARFPDSLPALSSVRYLTIVIFCVNHWLVGLVETSKFLLTLSGFVLQFAEERRRKDHELDLNAYFGIICRRFTKLYPLFALSTLVGYSYGYDCKPLKVLLVVPRWNPFVRSGTCFNGGWFIPVIMGCYVIFPIISQPLRKISFPRTCMLVCMSGTLFAFAQRGSLSFERISLLVNFPMFLIGMVLAHLWALVHTFRLYVHFSEFACPLSLIALLAKCDRNDMVEWSCFWRCVLIMALACPIQSRFNPVLHMLSWQPLVWMGENLAMPIYMLAHFAMRIVTKLYDDYRINARLPDAHAQSYQKLTIFVGFVVVVHTMAWMCSKLCRSTNARTTESAQIQSSIANDRPQQSPNLTT